MKKTILVAFLIGTSGWIPTVVADDKSYCELIRETAQTLMEARQLGLSLDQVLGDNANNQTVSDIADRAYGYYEVYESDIAREQAITGFARLEFNACIKSQLSAHRQQE